MAQTIDDLELENPLVEGLERLPVRPTSLVIFGATGDLAHRKLLPALYNLAHEGQLPERFEMIGVGTTVCASAPELTNARAAVATAAAKHRPVCRRTRFIAGPQFPVCRFISLPLETL